MYDHDNRRPRGFGFITFSEEEAVDKVFDRGTMQTIHDKEIEIKRAVPRDSMSPSPQRRPGPIYGGPPPHYYDPRSPYSGGGGRYGPPPPRYDSRGGYGTPHSGYGGGRGRGDLGGRSPMMHGRGGGPYTPPVVVTGIPASMAGVAPGEPGMTPPPGSGAQGGDGGGSGMGGVMGVPPQSPGPVTPGAMQGTPPGMVGGFAMQNGGAGGGGGGPAGGAGGQYAPVGSPPPFGLDPQQAAAALQQQVSLSSVTGALEQLQVGQPGQQGQGQGEGQGAQQGQQQPSTTIWS